MSEGFSKSQKNTWKKMRIKLKNNLKNKMNVEPCSQNDRVDASASGIVRHSKKNFYNFFARLARKKI